MGNTADEILTTMILLKKGDRDVGTYVVLMCDTIDSKESINVYKGEA